MAMLCPVCSRLVDDNHVCPGDTPPTGGCPGCIQRGFMLTAKDARIASLEAFLEKHEKWEAQLIQDRYPDGALEAMSGDLMAATRAIQHERNALLGRCGAAPAEATPTEPLFYILSLKWTRKGEYALTWWRVNDKGYTDDLDTAATHTLAEITDNRNHYNDGTDTLAVPCEVAREHTKTTRPAASQCFVPNTKAMKAAFKKAAKTITATDAK